MPTHETTEILQAVPVLPAQHIAATVQFYTQRLRFELLYQDETFAMLRRDVLRLHFWLCADRYIAESTSCYVYVRHIEPLYTECQRAGVVHPNGALEVKPYGVKEFTILDNNGNAIRFAERL